LQTAVAEGGGFDQRFVPGKPGARVGKGEKFGELFVKLHVLCDDRGHWSGLRFFDVALGHARQQFFFGLFGFHKHDSPRR